MQIRVSWAQLAILGLVGYAVYTKKIEVNITKI